ncbi:MAG TPA: hypothetical protein VIL67_13950 [Phenylobacterium sp.]
MRATPIGWLNCAQRMSTSAAKRARGSAIGASFSWWARPIWRRTYSMVATIRSALEGKWWSMAPRLTPARSVTTTVVVWW